MSASANNVIQHNFKVYSNKPEEMSGEEIQELEDQLAYMKAKVHFLDTERRVTILTIEELIKTLNQQKSLQLKFDWEESAMYKFMKERDDNEGGEDKE
jgi:hypothetical protein